MSTEVTTTAVVIPEPQAVAMVDGHSDMAAAMVYGEAVGQYYCSMAKDDPNIDEVLFRCSFDPTKKLSEMINSEVIVRHIYGKQATFVDEDTGEETAGTVTCLITPDNHVIQCCSKGVRASIAQLLQQHGSPHKWTHDIKVKIRQMTYGKKRMFALQQLGKVERKKATK